MSFKCSKQVVPASNSRSVSPVHVHVDRDAPVHVYVDGGDGKRSRRPKNPSRNVPTAKLMRNGKVIGSRNGRVRSVSPPWVPPPGKTTQGSLASLGPFWTEDEADLSQQSRYEKQINDLMREVGDLKDELDREKFRQKEEVLFVQDNEIEELKQELDAMEKENVLLRESLDISKSKQDKPVDDDNTGKLIQFLIEAELAGQRCEHQLHHVLEFLKGVLKEGYRVTARDIDRMNHMFHDANARLCDFKTVSTELRNLLKEYQQAQTSSRKTLMADNLLLTMAKEELESRLQQMDEGGKDKDKVIEDLRRQVAKLNEDGVTFATTHESLESIKAHLQQQLKQKSGDINRMAVQIRTLEGELAKERLDKEHLTELLKGPREAGPSDRDTLKRAARAQKQRAQRLEETVQELSALLADKEKQLEAVMEETKEDAENLHRMQQFADENERLRQRLSNGDQQQEQMIITLKRENETLRNVADQCEARLRDVERQMNHLRENIADDGEDKNDSHIGKLSKMLEKLETAEKSNLASQMRAEELERKVRNLESQNADLKVAAQEKESFVIDSRCKADDLARENSSLMRQLEASLMDNKRNLENARDKTVGKDRHMQTKVHDLESQLAQQRAEANKWRRNCEESERKAESKVNDLRVQLEQAERTNHSLQTYVQFLKKSYANVFGDLPLNGLGVGAGYGSQPINFGGM